MAFIPIQSAPRLKVELISDTQKIHSRFWGTVSSAWLCAFSNHKLNAKKKKAPEKRVVSFAFGLRQKNTGTQRLSLHLPSTKKKRAVMARNSKRVPHVEGWKRWKEVLPFGCCSPSQPPDIDTSVHTSEIERFISKSGRFFLHLGVSFGGQAGGESQQ